jgi:hypothetical protein
VSIGLVLPVDCRDHNEPPSELSSAHDELVGKVGVAFVANLGLVQEQPHSRLRVRPSGGGDRHGASVGLTDRL